MPRRRRLTSLVVMGVTGAGKSSLMAALVERLGWPALEGDAVHPDANVAKMAAGIPLTDEDRAPWLEAIAAWIGERELARESSIVTCSALRREYRDILRRGHPWVWLAHLVAPPAVLEDRVERRTGHYMPPSLLASQVATLEPLDLDEPGTVLEATAPPGQLADELITRLRLER